MSWIPCIVCVLFLIVLFTQVWQQPPEVFWLWLPSWRTTLRSRPGCRRRLMKRLGMWNQGSRTRTSCPMWMLCVLFFKKSLWVESLFFSWSYVLSLFMVVSFLYRWSMSFYVLGLVSLCFITRPQKMANWDNILFQRKQWWARYLQITIEEPLIIVSGWLYFTLPYCQVWCDVFSMNHDPEYWEDPWTFNPERFLDEQGQLVGVDHPNRRR